MVALCVSALTGTARAQLPAQRLQLDIQGSAMYSKYNFTDVVDPYDGVDAWMELKAMYWLDDAKRVAPYISIVPAYSSVDEFFWQRNVTAAIGLQYYPLYNASRSSALNPVRLFAQVSNRSYYDKDGDTEGDTDQQIGIDYYWDNLFVGQPWAALVYQNATWRHTNYSLDDYNAVVWNGNIKIGPKARVGDGLVLLAAEEDHSWVGQHDERWWENYVRLGAVLQWYPCVRPGDDHGKFAGDLLRRFHLFAEVLQNVAWLGDDAPDRVEETDYRAGIAFSTGGFLRDLPHGD